MSYHQKMIAVSALALLNGALVAAAWADAFNPFACMLFGVALPFFVAMVMLFREPQQ